MGSRRDNLFLAIGLAFLVIASISLYRIFWSFSPADLSGNLASNYDKEQSEILESPEPEEDKKPLSLEIDETIFAGEARAIESFPKQIDVQFPSGRSISVNYENDGYDLLPPLTAENIENYINLLKDLVEQKGNAVAANALRESLDDCSLSPRSEDAYRVRYDNLLTSGNRIVGSDDQDIVKVLPGSEDHEIALIGLKLNYLKCRNISDELIANRAVWSDRAIELNSYTAITRKAGRLLFEDPAAAHELYLKAWDAGHIGVGSALGLAFESGISNEDPDPVAAFAYTLAQNQVIKSYLEQSDSPRAIELNSLYASVLTGSENLTSAELLQAEELAIKLIQDNKNCCKAVWSSFD